MALLGASKQTRNPRGILEAALGQHLVDRTALGIALGPPGRDALPMDRDEGIGIAARVQEPPDLLARLGDRRKVDRSIPFSRGLGR
jgi:hypothetical protein